MKHKSLKNHLLVAMPTLRDPMFGRSVIYLYENSKEGSMGLIINKPMQIQLGSVLEHLEIETTHPSVSDMPVFMGGPVGQEHGFIIHLDDKKNTPLNVSASKETLIEIAEGDGPDEFMVVLGYAGWTGGQLESEIQRNDWLVVPFNPSILFGTETDKRWFAAARLLGIDMLHLSAQIGHA